jgi:hypothetical protein
MMLLHGLPASLDATDTSRAASCIVPTSTMPPDRANLGWLPMLSGLGTRPERLRLAALLMTGNVTSHVTGPMGHA